MRQKFTIVVFASFLALLGCEKADQPIGTVLKINLTDAPITAQEVNVEIQGIKVRFQGPDNSTDGKDWVWMETKIGVYNLLALQNGVSTLLATGSIPNSQVKEIRLILGNNNTIKVSGKVFKLVIPAAQTSGYKIKVDKKLASPMDQLLVDFDAGMSVSQSGEGNFKLLPVLRIK